MGDGDLLTPGDAGRILDLSADGVNYQSRVGRLPCIRTQGGRRLFLRADVERLAAQRAAARAAREER
jgi:DNA-binding transcriptional MerR regulator